MINIIVIVHPEISLRAFCKMKFLVINPNTSDVMTEDIRKTVNMVKSDDSIADVIHPDFGPEALESFYDYQLAAFGMLRLKQCSSETYDGILDACFGDPGLFALKEIFECPVIGIAEGSMAIANLLGGKFAILAASEKAVPMMENMVLQYGMKDRCAGVFSLDSDVLNAEKNKEETIKNLIRVGYEAKKKGADVLIPGCAGMTGLSKAVEQQIKLTVIDPVGISFGILEILARQKVNCSSSGLYAFPAQKKIIRKELLFC